MENSILLKNTESISAPEQNFILHAPYTYLPPIDYDENLQQNLQRESLQVFTFEEHKKIRARLMHDSAIQKMEEGSWEMSRRDILQRNDLYAGLIGGISASIISAYLHGYFQLQRELQKFGLFALGASSLSMLYHIIQTPRIEKEYTENVKLRESVYMPRAGQRDLQSIADRYVWDEQINDSNNKKDSH